MANQLLQLFPAAKRAFWQYVAEELKGLSEIRLRVGGPVILLVGGKEFFLNCAGGLQKNVEGAYCTDKEELDELLDHICHYSLYAYEDELRQGFLTVAGGHRVGIAGQAVLDNDGSIRTIKNISYLNIRIAHQMIGVADGLLPFLYDGKRVKNILIISPPGCGKTTLLRDLIRQVSNGNIYGEGRTVSVVDERSEIAGSYQGQPQNNIGIRTDVMDACPKALGILLLLRSMSPGVIALDELGGREDLEALHLAIHCGVSIMATIHGKDLEDVAGRLQWEELLGEGMFDLYIVMGRKNGIPEIMEMIKKEEVYASYTGRNYDCGWLSGAGNMVSRAVFGENKISENITGDSGNSDE